MGPNKVWPGVQHTHRESPCHRNRLTSNGSQVQCGSNISKRNARATDVEREREGNFNNEIDTSPNTSDSAAPMVIIGIHSSVLKTLDGLHFARMTCCFSAIEYSIGNHPHVSLSTSALADTTRPLSQTPGPIIGHANDDGGGRVQAHLSAESGEQNKYSYIRTFWNFQKEKHREEKRC